jgi:hypothetical protein
VLRLRDISGRRRGRGVASPAMSATDLAAGYELAFSEARRALDDQERVASDLRTRATALVATAAIAASFFGGGLAEQGLPWSGWIAVGCFCLVGVAGLAILWPHGDWPLDAATPAILDRFLERPEGPLPLRVIYRELIEDMEDSVTQHAWHLRLLTGCFRAGSMLLLVEVASWLVTMALAS